MKLQGLVLGRLVGHLGFLILMVMSVVLAQERVLFVDSAAQLFEMIQRESFVIYDHRYTMAVTQLLPLIGIKIGLSLPILVVLYSVAAPLLAYLAYLLLAYRVKDLPLALLLLLPMLCMRHTFFHAISETFSLMIYATLLLALLKHRRNTLLHAVGVVLCTVACVVMLPVGMFFVVFLLGYHLVSDRLSVPFIVGTATLLAAVIVKMNLGSGHDASYMPSVADALYTLRHPAEMQVVSHMFYRLFDLYIYPLALYVIVLVWHIRRRQWLRMSYCLAFNVFFFLLTAIVYRADTSSICVERAWLPLIFFAGVPMACEVVPAISRRKQNIALLIFFLALMLDYGKIVNNSRHYRQRLDCLQEIIESSRKTGNRKLVGNQGFAKERFEVQSWAIAFETLILSSMQGPDGSVTIYFEEGDDINVNNPDYSVEDAFLAVPWNRLWNYSTLNPRYFSLPLQGSKVI